MLKAGEISAAARAGNGGKTGVSFAMAAEAVEEEEISCVSGGVGLAFAEASFDLSEFATVRLSAAKFKKLQLLPNFAG